MSGDTIGKVYSSVGVPDVPRIKKRLIVVVFSGELVGVNVGEGCESQDYHVGPRGGTLGGSTLRGSGVVHQGS